LQNSNISYFAALNASYDQPMSILAGDGNLTASASIVSGTAGSRLAWTKDVHAFKGNVLFSDGHVEEWKDGAATLASATTIALPTTGGGGGTSSGGGSSGGSSSSGGGGGGGSGSSGSQPSQPPPATYNPANSGAARAPQMANAPGNAAPQSARSYAPQVNGRQNMGANAGGQGDTEISNSIAEDVTVTNDAPDTNGFSQPDDNSSTMSPANRKAASILRGVLGGSYLLILLLVLAYVAYRIRRWRQQVDRDRRIKEARARMLARM